MEYVTQYRDSYQQRRPPRPSRVTFRPWVLAGSLGFLAFALLYVSVGIRWHTYRARANLYAREEMELIFQAADYKRAANNPGLTEESIQRAQKYRRLAEMCTKAAEERTRLRELYEAAW